MKLRANLAAPILAMSMCLFAAVTARAEVYYLRGAPCRIYVDTDFIGLPDQCSTLALIYSRNMFLPRVRRLYPFHGRYH